MFRIESNPPAAYLFNAPIAFDPNLWEVTFPLELLGSLRIDDYPDSLHSNILVPDELQLIGAHDYATYRNSTNGHLQFSATFGSRKGVWRGSIVIGALYQALMDLEDIEDIRQSTRIDYDNAFLDFSADLGGGSEPEIRGAIRNVLLLWREVIERAERCLVGFKWRKEYASNESLFTKEVVIPIFRKVGYNYVRYNHGTFERGKDVLFSEVDRFGRTRHCAAQVKAGDVTQSNRTLLEKLRGQIDDAFALPVVGAGQNERFHIAEFYVVASGKITEEAIVRLNGKIDPRLIGSVHYLHRGHVEALAHELLLRRAET